MSRPQRGQGDYSEANFSPFKVSPSRVNALAQCGVAFQRKYMKGEKETRSGSASLFGSVMHEGLEKWASNRESSLLTLTRSAWLDITEGTIVNDFLGAYAALSTQAIRAAHEAGIAFEARMGRPTNVPRMTKEFKTHPVNAKIEKLLAEWIPKLNAESPWLFTERDPLPALYDESLVLSKKYEARWKKLPNALYTELAFDVKWRRDGNEWLLNGYIDAIEPLKNKRGKLIAILATDYKTYRNEPAAAKDERQMVMYDIALREMVARGEIELPDVPILICMDYVRLLDRKVAAVTHAAYDAVAAELLAYKAIVEAKAFLPAEKNRNPDYCGFEDCCLKCPRVKAVEVKW